MLDTNVLISAVLFPNKKMDYIVESITKRHDLILSTVIVKEFIEVAAYEKFNRVKDAKAYLKGLSYSEFESPTITEIEGLFIRDKDDYPVLFAAVKSGVDIFITGDKDFTSLKIERPKILTPAEFMEKYVLV
jgi:putative PIN family toxin of toxin-antitoxin system